MKTTMQELNEIDCEIYEGRLLMAALAVITTECRTNKTPREVIDELDKLSVHMFRGEEYYNQTYNQKQHIIDIMKADEDDGLYN
jgi:hypothetical protein